MLLKGNCLETLKTLPDNSVDSIVTDPPYGLEFMGKEWDAPWKQAGTVQSSIAEGADKSHPFRDGSSRVRYGIGNEASVGFQLWTEQWAAECLRVLKPGGHLLAFSGSRTYHRMVVAIEDSGFEIRDQIMWLYGSGFPKSLDVSKAIDKAAGAEREVVGTEVRYNEPSGIVNVGQGDRTLIERNITAPATSEAQQWQGWGTALKPAHEPIVVARKPLVGTVANNVLTYGTGALNIDGSRVGTSDTPRTGNTDPSEATQTAFGTGWQKSGTTPPEGRWPANVIHDGLDEDWARFFYCAKASKSERNAGLEGMPERREADREKDDGAGGDNPRNRSNTAKQNFHPTVKPLALMRYLVKLVTPPNGIVLDPFLGSGTTAVAATLEGFDWVGCEMTEDYWPIIEARVEWAQSERTTTLF